jgi:hypothetical protein
MGRVSNHKKARRRAAFTAIGGAALTARRMAPPLAAEGRRQLQYLAAEQVQTRFHQEREERYAQACRAWRGGAEPALAATPQWMRGPFGGSLAANQFLAEAYDAPCLATAVVPPAVVIADDPTQWRVAANVLIRAVAFDRLDPGHPAVTALLDALAPVIEAELRYWPVACYWLLSDEVQQTQPAPGFPVLDGPVACLSMFLADAARAVASSDADTEEIAVLSRALDGTIPGVAGSVVADTLIENVNPLQFFADSGAVEPSQVLRVGLAVLSSLLGAFGADPDLSTRQVA